jgi:predicted transcriptional regulator
MKVSAWQKLCYRDVGYAINDIWFVPRKRYCSPTVLVWHMVRVRKGAVQIRFEILEYLFYNRGPQPRTYVWRKATSLSYDDFLKHLSYLIERRLLRETDEGQCALTEKGRNIYSELRKSLPSIL